MAALIPSQFLICPDRQQSCKDTKNIMNQVEYVTSIHYSPGSSLTRSREEHSEQLREDSVEENPSAFVCLSDDPVGGQQEDEEEGDSGGPYCGNPYKVDFSEAGRSFTRKGKDKTVGSNREQ
jgi:hypothetical protein